VDTYRIVLFVHLLALLVLTGAISVIGVSYFRLRAAQSLQDAVPWAALAGRTGWLFPVSIIGLFASGAYLTNDSWTWSTPWIDVSIAGIVLIAAQGPSVAGPATKQLDRALREHGPGPLDERTLRLARAPALWFVVLVNPAIVLAIIWVMTVKPGAAGAIAAIVVGYAAGAGATVLLSRHQVPGAATLEAPGE
jgi:Predicted integral membrane protein (DUF2269)